MSTRLIDALGNEIFENNWVAVKLGGEIMVGKVVKITYGGIDIPNSKARQTNGMMMIGFQMPILFEPRAEIGFNNIYRVIDPNAQGLVENAMDKEKHPPMGGPSIVP